MPELEVYPYENKADWAEAQTWACRHTNHKQLEFVEVDA